MKSIKPGRGPSGMSFIGSIIAIIFGVFWTIMAVNITANASFAMIGMIFPLFGILFITVGVIQAVYSYKNATGRNRYSIYDITDSNEEGDPSDSWVKNDDEDSREYRELPEGDINYCPYCGVQLKSGYAYCPKCGKDIHDSI